MPRVSFFTLGCRLNQSETVVLEGVFRDRGFEIVPFTSPADVAVINSCTVTAAGDIDARKAVNKTVRLNAAVHVAVIGCQAQVQKKKILSWPNVRWVVGTGEKMNLADIVGKGFLAGGVSRVIVPGIRREAFTLPSGRIGAALDAARVRANIKIQDGCDRYCAYCEIPYARGRSRSRVFADILAEAGALGAAGYKELVITGVNVGDYADGGRILPDVICEIEKIPGIERIRLSSIEHTRLPLELVEFMRPPHKLCRFLHIPLQSGCDRTLRRMGRNYTTGLVAHLAGQLTAMVPQLMIGTDIIVGFPGETEKDFEATRLFLASLPVHYFHVFSYSNRERARSRGFQGMVPGPEIHRRSGVLRLLGNRKHAAFLESLSGTEQTVLFEQKKKLHWIGHTDNYVTIKVSSMRPLRNMSLPVMLGRRDGGSMMATLKE